MQCRVCIMLWQLMLHCFSNRAATVQRRAQASVIASIPCACGAGPVSRVVGVGARFEWRTLTRRRRVTQPGVHHAPPRCSMSTRAHTTQSKRLGRSGRLYSSTFICAVARDRGFFTAGSTCFQPLPCHSCVSLNHSLAPLHGGARLCVCRRGMCAARPDPTMLRPQPRTMLQL